MALPMFRALPVTMATWLLSLSGAGLGGMMNSYAFEKII
jgi:hypothetical protein